MAKRVLAVIGAVALVLAALVVRSLIDGDDRPRAGGDRGGSRALVVCDPDLRRHCEAMEDVELRIEDSAVTSAAIVSGEAEVGFWVTTSAWVELTLARQDRASLALAEPTLLATSPVGLHALTDRAEVLSGHCSGPAPWRCVGDAAGRPWTEIGGPGGWGSVRIGLPDPDTALGLATLSSVAVGYFDGPDFAANDFAGFRDWLGRLAAPSRGGDRSLLRTLLRVRGTYDAAVLTGAEASGQTGISPVEVAPEVLARVVAVPVDSDLRDRAIDDLRASLAAGGWRPESTGELVEPLLGRGVMGALHELWKDVAR